MSEQSNITTHYTAILLGALSGLTFNQWVALVMAVIGVATFLMNWHYKQKHYELAVEQHRQSLTQPKDE